MNRDCRGIAQVDLDSSGIGALVKMTRQCLLDKLTEFYSRKPNPMIACPFVCLRTCLRTCLNTRLRTCLCTRLRVPS